MLLLRIIILSLLFLFLKFYFLYYICDVPHFPKSLKFGGTSTPPPCASPRTHVPPSRSLGGTLGNLA
jgi:hypothetical protein